MYNQTIQGLYVYNTQMADTINYTLKQHICENIERAGGKISFYSFMQYALYAPNLGFYLNPDPKFGKQGHFVTAPELSPHFAQCVAKHLQVMLQQEGLTHILEFGGGSGQLALDLLLCLERSDCLPDAYCILEVSGNLQSQQALLIKEKAPHLFNRCHWLTSLPSTPINACVIANEVLDAMPVHRFVIQENTVKEIYVAYEENQFVEHLEPCSQALSAQLSHLSPLLDNYESEVNLCISPWLRSLYSSLNKALVLLFDYGFPQAEYYHADRHQGTLMCHHRHKSHSNPYLHLGEQDITAHVDFSCVAESAHDVGFEIKGYTTQASFLLANGITTTPEGISEQDRFTSNQAIKKLTLPHEMGELFKVIALGKKLQTPLQNFSLTDLRRQL